VTENQKEKRKKRQLGEEVRQDRDIFMNKELHGGPSPLTPKQSKKEDLARKQKTPERKIS
jgi:hypothetical protein